jgi:hypothetical protein
MPIPDSAWNQWVREIVESKVSDAALLDIRRRCEGSTASAEDARTLFVQWYADYRDLTERKRAAVHEREVGIQRAGLREEMLAIAEFFIQRLASAARVEAYLAGGAAIAFQGGQRPIADLDLRIDGARDLLTFTSGRGPALLRTINRNIVVAARQNAPSGKQINEFKALGEDALTIGTNDWLGFEVSLSIHQPELKHESLTTVGRLRALRPVDLLRDKLKTVITRTKRGGDSVKKVAQDLFDVLTLMKMMPDRNFRDTGELLQHFIARSAQYAIANLEPFDLPRDLEEQIVAVRMLDRFIHTVDAHLQVGAREEKFSALLIHDPSLAEQAGALGALDAFSLYPGSTATTLGTIGRRRSEGVEAVVLGFFRDAAHRIQDELVHNLLAYAQERPEEWWDLQPWFREWNSPPFSIPLRWAAPRSRLAQIEEKGAEAGSAVALAQARKMGLSHEDQVLYILYRSGGSLELDMSDQMAPQTVFGLSRSQLDRAKKALLKKTYVEATRNRLSLTDLCSEQCRKKWR